VVFLVAAHVPSRPSVSEQSFLSVRCFQEAACKMLSTSFNTLPIATVVILSYKTQSPLTANDHYAMATFTHTRACARDLVNIIT
jgi:hypothetical protein